MSKHEDVMAAGEIPKDISKWRYIKKYASHKFYKRWKIMGVVGYLLYPVLFLSQFWFAGTQLERLFYLGLLLGTHLSKNKVCAIILTAFGAMIAIADVIILRIGLIGFTSVAIGITALHLLNGAEKEYWNWKQTNK